MSTKIYDGLRGTIEDPFELAAAMRFVLEREFHERFRGLADAMEKLDPGELAEALGGQADKPLQKARIPSALHEAIQRVQESKTWTMSPLAIGYEVCLLPNGAGGAPLAMVYGETAGHYRALLLKTGVVEQYGYWDNTDPEEGVSEDDWATRKLAWTPIFNHAPSEIGLSFTHPSSIASELAYYHK